jgi:hypothetical protein
MRFGAGTDYTVFDPESKDTFYLNVCTTVLKEAYGVETSKISTLGVYRERDGQGQSLRVLLLKFKSV